MGNPIDKMFILMGNPYFIAAKDQVDGRLASSLIYLKNGGEETHRVRYRFL
jgi:hypothetical protein